MEIYTIFKKINNKTLRLINTVSEVQFAQQLFDYFKIKVCFKQLDDCLFN